MMRPGAKGLLATYFSTRTKTRKSGMVLRPAMARGLLHETFEPRSRPTRRPKTATIRMKAPRKSILRILARQCDLSCCGTWTTRATAMKARMPGVGG